MNTKYPDLSSPILQVVLSILQFDHTGHMTIRSHDHSTTIAAIFDNGKKLLSVKIGCVLKNQPVMVTSSVVCSYCYVNLKP